MKKMKFMMAVMMMVMSVTASAQFANQSSNKSSKSGSNSGSVIVKDCKSYNRISLSYAPLTTTDHYGSKSYDSFTLQGFKFGWTGGYSVSEKLPFFIETGLDLSFNTKSSSTNWVGSFKDEDDDDYGYYDEDYKIRSTTMGLTIPVNVTYKLTFKNNFYISPYFGLHFKLNLLGQNKMKYDGDDDYGYYYDDEEDNKTNWFSKKDMGGSDATYNRFQMGWQIGTNLGYKKFNFNVGYASDFIPLYKHKKAKITTGGVVVGVGVNF